MFSSVLDKNKKIELEVKKLGIFELRGLAREVGVSSPTTKKREELIDLILEKLNKGQIEDIVGSKKGRPFKKLAVVDNILSNMTVQEFGGNFSSQNKAYSYEDILAFAQVMPIISNVEQQILNSCGIIRKSITNDMFMFYDFKTNQAVFLPVELKFVDKVKNGDIVSVKAKKINNNQFFATEILSINNVEAPKYLNRSFNKGQQIISEKVLPFANKNLFIGRRNLVELKENFYENKNFDILYKSAIEKGYKVVMLSLNSSIEDELKMQSMKDAVILSTKFNDDCDRSLNKAVDCVSLCENLVENGEKVLLIVPDMINVIRAIDCCFMEEKKMYEHAMQSIVVAQKILSLGAAYENNCDITLLVGYDQLDKNDLFLNNQLYKICKII